MQLISELQNKIDQIWEVWRKTNKSATITEDFYIPISVPDRSTLKIIRDIENLNSSIKEIELVDVFSLLKIILGNFKRLKSFMFSDTMTVN